MARHSDLKYIFKSWLEYISFENILQEKISFPKRKGQISFSLENVEVYSNGKVNVVFSDSQKEFINSLKGNSFCIGLFPLIVEDEEKNKGGFYPLFILKYEFNSKEKIDLDGIFSVPFFTEEMFFLSVETFKRFLGVDLKEYTITAAYSIGDVVEEVLGIKNILKGKKIDEKKFLAYLKKVCWKIKEILEERKNENAFFPGKLKLNNLENNLMDFVVFSEVNLGNPLYFVKKFYDKAVKNDYIESLNLGKNSPLYKYFFVDSEKDEYKNYQFQNHLVCWKGYYTDYPLSNGQKKVIEKLVDGENLIAVQGPPGTGKTSLLLNIVANRFAERILGIIENEELYSGFIVIASTAKKAVANAAKDFGEMSEKNSFYSDFYLGFIESQKSQAKRSVQEFIKNFKKELEKDIETEKKDKLGEEIKNLSSRIDVLFKEFYKLKAEILKFSDFESEINAIGKKLNDLTLLLQNYEKEIAFFENNLKEKNIEFLRLKQITEYSGFLKREQFDIQWLWSYQEDKDFIFKLKQFAYREKNKGFKDKIKEFFLKRENNQLENFIVKNSEKFENYNIDYLKVRGKNLSEILKRIEKINFSAKKMREFEKNAVEFAFKNEDKITDYETKLKKIPSLKKEITDLEKRKAFLHNKKKNLLDRKNDVEGRIYQLNRELFKKTIDYAYYFLIENGEEVLEAVKLFDAFFYKNKKDSSSHSSIINFGVEKMFNLVSLVFPVLGITLHSAPVLFNSFDKTFRARKSNPVSLFFIDEAGMALPHLAAPLIAFSDNVVCVGDPLQLKPVVPLTAHEENYYYEEMFFKGFKFEDEKQKLEYFEKFSPTKISAYHRAAGCKRGDSDYIGKAVFLDEHRRCQKPIAELFKKIANYENLSIKTLSISDISDGKNNAFERLKKFTKNFSDDNSIHYLFFFDVPGIKSERKNTNIAEIEIIDFLLDKLEESGFNLKNDVGIITPFFNQERLLIKKLGKRIGHGKEKAKIGTVHKFQGVEYKIIIFSQVVSGKDNSVSFINKSPNLLNVAVSRAKELFIAVGDGKKAVSSGGYLKKMYEFIKKEGIIKNFSMRTFKKEEIN